MTAARTEPAPHTSLREHTARAVRRYLHDRGDCETDQLYQLVLDEVEAGLLSETLKHCGGNQSRAAAVLGINRATLRKKLEAHGLLG